MRRALSEAPEDAPVRRQPRSATSSDIALCGRTPAPIPHPCIYYAAARSIEAVALTHRPRAHAQRAAVDERQAGQLVGRPAARVVQRRRPQGAAAAGGRVGARTRAGGGEVNRESAKARAREGKESTGVSDDVAATTTT